jgi:EmrB/QacA subfamily drug resistance transporter
MELERTAVLPPVAASPDAASRAAWRTLAVASLAVFVVSLDTTILFVAFPSIRRTFAEVSPEGLSWVLNAYTIGYGSLLVPAGRMADRFGRRRFFLAGVGVFTGASVLCGLAPGVGTLVASRALQSLGSAMLVPASFALVLHAFPASRRGAAVGIWGAVGALAAALGPGVGSAVVQFASLRWAFLLNLPLGLVALRAGARRLAESRDAGTGPLPDVLGAALLICAFGALSYGIVGARAAPAQAHLALGASPLLLTLFVVRSMRARSPALDLRLFQRRTFAIANLTTLVFSVAFTAMFFGNVFFLTQRWGLPVFEAGLWISPGPLAVIPVAVLAGRRADRVGYRPLLVLGGILFAIGGAWFLHWARAPASLAIWIPGSVVMGAAVGLVLPSLGGASALGLDVSILGVASGVNQAIRQLGSVLGVALVVVTLGAGQDPARFETIFGLLVAGGLLTMTGGALLPPPRPRRGNPERSG